MKDHGARQKIHQRRHEADPAGKSPSQKPHVKQLRRRRQAHDRSPHQIIPHFHGGKQIRDQDHRTEQPIIRKMIDILPASDICREFRKQFPRFIELLPKIIRNHTVLTDPVHIRAKNPKSPDEAPAEEHRRQHQQKERQNPHAAPTVFLSVPHRSTPPLS